MKFNPAAAGGDYHSHKVLSFRLELLPPFAYRDGGYDARFGAGRNFGVALKPHRYQDIVSWGYPESVFNSDYDIISNTGKARRLGFQDSMDTEEMFLRVFAEFRRNRVIP